MSDNPLVPPKVESYPYRRWITGSVIRWSEMRAWWDALASGDPARIRKVADELRACLDDDRSWMP